MHSEVKQGQTRVTALGLQRYEILRVHGEVCAVDVYNKTGYQGPTIMPTRLLKSMTTEAFQ